MEALSADEMSLGDPIRGRICQGLYSPAIIGLPIFSTGFEDQDLSIFDINQYPAFWTISPSPSAYNGSYCLQGSGNESIYGSILARSLKSPYPKKLFTRFYIKFTSIHASCSYLYFLFRVGQYVAIPYGDFLGTRSRGISARKVGATWYWAPEDILSSSSFVPNQWYRVETMISESTRKYEVRIDGTSIHSSSIPTSMIGYLRHFGLRLYPNTGTLTYLVDSLALGTLDWIGDKYLALRIG